MKLLVAVAAVVLGSLVHAARPAQPGETVPQATAVPGPVIQVTAAERTRLIDQAAVFLPPGTRSTVPAAAADSLECVYLAEPPSGTSPKFTCVLEDGVPVKVKYGRTPEIYAEPAATDLLTRLGFAADTVRIVERIRCYGCPRFPHLTAHARKLPAIGPLLPLEEPGYTEFEQVAVEWRFPAPAIESEEMKGWAWWELEGSTAPAAHLDALRLLAAFLVHWDNKAENQRLVCLDAAAGVSSCARPLLVVHDVGATFGPMKANLAAWSAAPLWSQPRTCLVSMAALPFRGGTFPDVAIGEAGRRLLLERLRMLDRDALEQIIRGAHLPAYHAGTDDARDVAAWVAAFERRVGELEAAGPCPPSGQQAAEALTLHRSGA